MGRIKIPEQWQDPRIPTYPQLLQLLIDTGQINADHSIHTLRAALAHQEECILVQDHLRNTVRGNTKKVLTLDDVREAMTILDGGQPDHGDRDGLTVRQREKKH